MTRAPQPHPSLDAPVRTLKNPGVRPWTWSAWWCLTSLLGGLLCARADDPARPYIAQTWTSEEGLPSTEVTALLQSRDGYLWVGTPGGLARFDGDRFVTARKSEAPGLASNRILSLCSDAEGGIWIGTDGGGLTHQPAGTPELTPRVQGLSSLTVLSVYVDDRGDVWAGTAAGLNRWQVNRFVPYMKVDGLPDETITVLIPRPRGGLLIGTAAGVGEFRDGRFTIYSPAPALPAGRVAALLADRAGRVWIAGAFGLWSAQPGPDGRAECHQVWSDPTTSLLERRNGEVWAGTASGSLRALLTDQASPVEVHRFDSPSAALLEDHEASVWVGSRQGLTRLKRRQLRFLGPDHGPELVAYAASPSGTEVRVRKDGTASFSLAGTESQASWLPPATLVKTADVLDRIFWVGTSGEGLRRWDGQSDRVWGQREGLSDIFVESLYAEGPDSVWVGTRNGGLNHVTPKGVRRYLTPWGYTGNYANALAAEAGKTLWVGTSGDGLFALRDGEFTHYNSRSALPDDRITALAVEPDGAVWVGTAAGLAFWDGARWHGFSNTGVPMESIDQMQEDDFGHLWLGCGQTVYRLETAELRAVAAGRRDVIYPVPFARSDGLAGATLIPGVHVSPNSRRDQVVFLTSRGLLAIEPGHLDSNTNPPPVLIQEVMVGSEAVSTARRVEVPPGRQTIQFRFAALSYAAPEKVRFRCKLSGYDNDWVEAGGSRTMRYARVPPGKYRFQVTACNNDGLWNTTGASVALNVSPFWWETAWFRIAAALLAGGAVLYLLQLRRQRRREIEHLRVRIAGDLHDEIGSSLWSITLLSKMLQQGSSLGDEEKRDAGEIHRIATQTSNALRDIVWLINPGLDTLQDMVLRMRDFLSATIRGTEVQVRADEADLSRKLSLELRQSFFLVFKEAVTNAAKHARARHVEVVLSEKQGVLELCVRDNGRGFRPEEPTQGHGLQSLKRRAAAVRGQLVIESAPGGGTSVVLRANLGGFS